MAQANRYSHCIRQSLKCIPSFPIITTCPAPLLLRSPQHVDHILPIHTPTSFSNLLPRMHVPSASASTGTCPRSNIYTRIPTHRLISSPIEPSSANHGRDVSWEVERGGYYDHGDEEEEECV